MSKNKEKIIVILGQTATGKSALAVKLAKKLNGEIISADSRQVYKGLDIGTGKITKKEMRGVPHHLLDVKNPRRQFTVAEYKKFAEQSLRYIVRKNKVSIVVGGTGFYIDALLSAINLPNVPPNKKLRARLEKKSAEKLFLMLRKLDFKRTKIIDRHNRRRLIRALEIVRSLGEIPLFTKKEKKYDVLKIGIKIDNSVLKEKIKKRLTSRMKRGMLNEIQKLHRKGLSWKRMEELGLEYRYAAQYLQGKITKEEMLKRLNTAIWQYARRQKTWFKRDKNIRWFSPYQYKKIEHVTKNFL